MVPLRDSTVASAASTSSKLAGSEVASSAVAEATSAVSDVVAALAIGAAGYGLSITLWVKGARDLGAARGQAIFVTAPYIGALIAWTLLGDAATASAPFRAHGRRSD